MRSPQPAQLDASTVEEPPRLEQGEEMLLSRLSRSFNIAEETVPGTQTCRVLVLAVMTTSDSYAGVCDCVCKKIGVLSISQIVISLLQI